MTSKCDPGSEAIVQSRVTARDDMASRGAWFDDPYLTLEVMVAPPVSVGRIDGAERRMIPIVGGVVSGAYHGAVLPGGADWQMIGPGGCIDISARYLLEVDGGVIEIRSEGVRVASPDVAARLGRGDAVDAHEYYFRTGVRFRTGAPALAHLNGKLAVGSGERLPDRVRLRVVLVP